jgi:hypothetical protein
MQLCGCADAGCVGVCCVELFAQRRQRFDNVASEVLRGFEVGGNALLANTCLQCCQFCGTCACLNVLAGNRMVLVYEEDQPRFIPFDCAVVLHLGNGDVVSVRYITVAIGKDADIHIRLFNHTQGDINRVGIERCEMLHHLPRLKPRTLASQPHLLAVLRQIARRTRNHHDLAIRHIPSEGLHAPKFSLPVAGVNGCEGSVWAPGQR